MSPENDQKLRAAWPLVFQKPLANNEAIRCRDGWYQILDDLCRALTLIIGFKPKEERHKYAAVQVKEKFGRLEFYLEDRKETLAVAWAVRCAQEASVKTCDVCGEPGSLRSAGFARTRCDSHVDSR